MSSKWPHRLAWIAIGWIVVFWRLGYPALLDPDEAHYAQLTREMLQSGSWLIPLLDGKPFIDKPVLFHWLQGASVALLGPSEFAVRLPSAVAALGLFAITRWVGVALLGGEAGELGAMMFATIPATFVLASVGLFDMVFTLFLFGGVAALLVGWKAQRRRIEWAGYGFLTLAVMTKGPVALVLVLLFIGALTIAGRQTVQLAQWWRWKTGLSLVVLAACPWFLWMWAQFGQDFVQGYVLAGNLWYFTQPPEFSGRAVNYTFYARMFVGGFFPWSAVVLGRSIDLVRARLHQVTVEEKALWIWALLVIVFFSVARFKLDHYIFPAAPACCLLAARAWRDASSDTERRFQATRYLTIGLGGALTIGAGFLSVWLFNLNLDLPAAAVLLPVALGVGGAGLLTLSSRRGWNVPRTAAPVLVMLLASYATVVAIGFPILEQTRPTALVAGRLARFTSPASPVGIYRLERWRASLRFYLERPVTSLQTREDFEAFLARPEQVYVVMLRSDYDAFRREGAAIHMVFHRRAVVGTTGRGLRAQQWGALVVATNEPRHRHRVLP